MIPPSGFLFKEQVTIKAKTEPTDTDGGIVETYASPGITLPAFVRDTGNVYDPGSGGIPTAKQSYTVSFPSDPAILKGDKLVWVGKSVEMIAQQSSNDRDGFGVKWSVGAISVS